MELNLKLDINNVENDIKKNMEKIKKNIEADLLKAANTLVKSGKKHAEELAKQKMPDKLSKIYTDNLYIEEVNSKLVILGIREPAYWLETGRKSGFMDELLNYKSGSPVKVSKEGHKYRVIPFSHDTSAPTSNETKQEIISDLKKFLKNKGIPYSKTRKLELDANGSPRIGKISSFDIKKNANLHGVSIYQNMNKKTGRVERSIMTFRVISEKSKEEGKWNHPGRKGEFILKDVFQHISNVWQSQILPSLKDKYESR